MDEATRTITWRQQEALQLSAIVPSLTVDDLQKSMAFYEALGFAVEERWEDKGTLVGVMLRAGKSQIRLSQDDWKKGRDRKKGIGMRLFMSTTQNVGEIARRAKGAGRPDPAGDVTGHERRRQARRWHYCVERPSR